MHDSQVITLKLYLNSTNLLFYKSIISQFSLHRYPKALSPQTLQIFSFPPDGTGDAVEASAGLRSVPELELGESDLEESCDNIAFDDSESIRYRKIVA